MKKRIWILLITLLGGWNIALSQVKLSAIAGGGISDLQNGLPFSDNSYLDTYLKPGPLFQAGASVSSMFRKEGMLSWEAQLLLRRSTLRSVPIDYDNADCTDLGGGTTTCSSPFPRDYSNVYRWNYWSVNVPVSLNFQVFGPIGWKIGGNVNYLLSKNSKIIFIMVIIIKIQSLGLSTCKGISASLPAWDLNCGWRPWRFLISSPG